MKIIVADDLQVLRDQMLSLVEAIPGIDVLWDTLSSKSAIAVLQAQSPDVVVLDIQRTGNNGLDVLRKLKKVPSPPLVIMLAKEAEVEHRKQCLNAGADYFLDSSSEPKGLEDVLTKFQWNASREPEAILWAPGLLRNFHHRKNHAVLC